MLSSVQVNALSTDHTAGGEEETRSDRKVDPVEDDPEATEDEEVKVNCIGGSSGIQDSDMSSDDESSDEESVPGDENPEDYSIPHEARQKHGLVHFVAAQQSLTGLDIQRPRAVFGFHNDQHGSSQKAEEVDEEDASSMDDSSDSSSCGARGVRLTLEVNGTQESSDEESLSDDECLSDEESQDVSSGGGIAGSDSESYVSEDGEEKPQGAASESEDGKDDMSDDESVTSVPLACFKNCDVTSDVVELERALQDSKHDSEEKDPAPSIALLSKITELEPKSMSPRDAFSHAKRVLSCNALLGPTTSSGQTMLSPKRACRVHEAADKTSSDDDMMPPELTLLSVEENQDPGIGLSLRTYDYSYEYETNPLISPSDDDSDEQDRQLGEELEETGSEPSDRVSTPIPLLTPPASPLRVESEEGPAEVCEWPSNLAVDNAMVAAFNLRPPSPESLQTWEQEEEVRLMTRNGAEWSPKPTPGDGSALSSTLTPMLRGISVQGEAPYLRL